MSVYYNDIDPFCCEWMRQLIKHGLVPGGRVDCRSIADIKASDLQGFPSEWDECAIAAGLEIDCKGTATR